MDWPVRVIRLASDPQENGLWCSPPKDFLSLDVRSYGKKGVASTPNPCRNSRQPWTMPMGQPHS
jgi:hypothetical protein